MKFSENNSLAEVVGIEPVCLASSSPFLRSKQIEDVQEVQNGQLDKILSKIIS